MHMITIPVITLLSVAAAAATHPITLASLILAQTLMMCLLSSFLLSSPWYSFILFMIFLGGVMVLFMYTTSLASNENFSWTWVDSVKILAPAFTMTALLLLAPDSTTLFSNLSLTDTPIKLYTNQMLFIAITLMVYLLLTLIVIAEIVKLSKAPMRSMF